MKLWVDPVRPAPNGYRWLKSINEIKDFILNLDRIKERFYIESGLYNINLADGERNSILLDIEQENTVTVIDIGYNTGEYVKYDEDYIKLLDWFEETKRKYLIYTHSMNPVGIKNMKRIIKRNRWEEV